MAAWRDERKYDAALAEFESWIQHRYREPKENDKVMVWQYDEWQGPGIITRNIDKNGWVIRVEKPGSSRDQDAYDYFRCVDLKCVVQTSDFNCCPRHPHETESAYRGRLIQVVEIDVFTEYMDGLPTSATQYEENDLVMLLQRKEGSEALEGPYVLVESGTDQGSRKWVLIPVEVGHQLLFRKVRNLRDVVKVEWASGCPQMEKESNAAYAARNEKLRGINHPPSAGSAVARTAFERKHNNSASSPGARAAVPLSDMLQQTTRASCEAKHNSPASSSRARTVAFQSGDPPQNRSPRQPGKQRKKRKHNRKQRVDNENRAASRNAQARAAVASPGSDAPIGLSSRSVRHCGCDGHESCAAILTLGCGCRMFGNMIEINGRLTFVPKEETWQRR